MKVLSVSFSDITGGAARAAYRLHHALRHKGVNSTMLVSNAVAGDWTVEGPPSIKGKAISKIRDYLGQLLARTLKTENKILHSPAFVPSRWSDRLNSSDSDIIHLHWINREMLSVTDIGRIRKPCIWTLHDMWPFCGAEHVTDELRWRYGYTKSNRPSHEHGFDLNRWTWERKLKRWQYPMNIVAPSRWLADCARQSKLMSTWPISVIPNAIDTNIWRPIEKSLARSLLHLPLDKPLLAFGAFGGLAEPHKGFDLLREALEQLRDQLPQLELLIFGQLSPKDAPSITFPVHYLGHLHDDVALNLLYSSADAVVIPSRIDNLPNAGLEAHACGTPVVAFDVCGLPDIVDQKKTGYLARPFDTGDLAAGLNWVLNDAGRGAALGIAARARAVRLWSCETVTAQYYNLYQSAQRGNPSSR